MDINQKVVNACQRLASTEDAIMYYVQTKATPEERVNALKNLSWKTVENYIYNVIDMNDLVEERSNGWEVSTSGSSFNGGWSVSTSPMQDAFNRTKNIVDGNVKRKDIVALADDVTLEGYL